MIGLDSIVIKSLSVQLVENPQHNIETCEKTLAAVSALASSKKSIAIFEWQGIS